MKKILTITAAVFLSGFLVAAVNAAPSDNAGGLQKNIQSSPKKTKQLSKRNKAKIEAQKMKEQRNALISSTAK